MSTEILLPKIGFSMTEGVFSEWMVADGAEVKQGEPLYAFETDKAIEEVEAPVSGILRANAVPGETYEVGAVIGVIE